MPHTSPPPLTRIKRTFYLDKELIARVEQEYRAAAHHLYPAPVPKSAFLEALIIYGLTHLTDVEQVLSGGGTLQKEGA